MTGTIAPHRVWSNKVSEEKKASCSRLYASNDVVITQTRSKPDASDGNQTHTLQDRMVSVEPSGCGGYKNIHVEYDYTYGMFIQDVYV